MANRWCGSLQNRLAEMTKQPKPEIGMFATEMLWSDRKPYEIVAIKDERHITVRGLDWKRTDHNGISESQEYEYTSNPENHKCELFLTKNGRWVERIDRHYGCTTFVLGFAERYYDPSF